MRRRYDERLHAPFGISTALVVGGAMPQVLIDFTNTSLFPQGGMSPAAFAAAAGFGMGFSDATGAIGSILTAQTSASTRIDGIAPGNARLGSYSDGNREGVYIENATTTALVPANQYNSAAGSTITSGITDPAGGATAKRVQCPSPNGVGQGSNYTGISGSYYYYSEWHQQGPGNGAFGYYFDAAGNSGAASVAWQRDAFFDNAAGVRFNPERNNGVAKTVLVVYAGAAGQIPGGVNKDCNHNAVQVEIGFHATSFINGAATRAAGLLSTTSPKLFIRGNGELDLEFRFTAGAPLIWYDPRVNIPVLYRDANNNIQIQMPSGQILITINGITQALPGPVSWASVGDVIDFYIVSGGTSRPPFGYYRYMPAGSTTFTTRTLGSIPTKMASWPTTGTYFFGSDGTNTRLNGIVNLIGAS